MTEHKQATILALDAYQKHLLGDLANGHRNDRAEAEGLLHSLVIDLINYGEANHLNVGELMEALVQARIDRGGALINPRYSFRLDTEVQFRDREADDCRGFITELASSDPGQDAECVLRVPGITDPQYTLTSELEPATLMAPVSTRTSGTIFSASVAEDTIIRLIARLPAQSPEAAPDTQLLADLAELSTALAIWSGTRPEQVLHHLRQREREIHQASDDWSSAARRAGASFPDDIAASLAREQPDPPLRDRAHVPA